MLAVQVEITVAIDSQRTFDHARRTVVFNRRRLRANLYIDVLAAPVSGGNALHFSGLRNDGTHRQQNDNQNSRVMPRKHSLGIVGLRESFTQRRKEDAKAQRNFVTSRRVVRYTTGENDHSSKSA